MKCFDHMVYCGVGCSFKAEIKDKEVVRIPIQRGSANKGHGYQRKIAWGYANHQDRIKSHWLGTALKNLGKKFHGMKRLICC